MIYDDSVFQLLIAIRYGATYILKLNAILKQNTEASDSMRNTKGHISI